MFKLKKKKLTLKLYIKHKLINQIINTIWLTQNLMCILKITKVYHPTLRFKKS